MLLSRAHVLLSALLLTAAVHSCPPGQLAVYRLVLDTHWSRDLFPKQYPEFRPPAQWSRLIGRTHDEGFHLFSEGRLASSALQQFAEKGIGDEFDGHRQGAGGVLDTFSAEKITKGDGRTQSIFFLNTNHSKMSFVMRMIPSPDWFIGVDSIDLCDSQAGWVKEKTIQLSPLDAGTDSGMTFTAPNWPNDPPQPITVLTAHEPEHPAASFYYPEMKNLPDIATLHLIKMRVYSIGREFHQLIPDNPTKIISFEDLQLEEMNNHVQTSRPTEQIQTSTLSVESTTPAPTTHLQTTTQQPSSTEAPTIRKAEYFTVRNLADGFSVLKRNNVKPSLIKNHPAAAHQKPRGLDTSVTRVRYSAYSRPFQAVTRVKLQSQPRGVGQENIPEWPRVVGAENRRHQRQRVRALRRRKLAARRKQQAAEAAATSTSRSPEREFITSDGNRFDEIL